MSTEERAFQSEYDGLRDSLEAAKREASRLIAKAIAQVGNPFLVRGILDAARVKAFPSVLNKCRKRGLSPGDMHTIGDLVGLRVVCANLEDVARLVELLSKISGLSVVKSQKKRGPDGYRAVHIDARLGVTVGGKTTAINCEIQLRTFLQDSWAKQTHHDLLEAPLGN